MEENKTMVHKTWVKTSKGYKEVKIIDQPVSKPHPIRNMEILVEDYEFNFQGLHFIVKKGFPWDGASVPPLADRFCGHKFEPDNRRFGLAHDVLFRSGITTRKKANEWCVKILLQRENVGKKRAWFVLKGLQIGSIFAWNSHRKRPAEWQKQYIEVLHD